MQVYQDHLTKFTILLGIYLQHLNLNELKKMRIPNAYIL